MIVKEFGDNIWQWCLQMDEFECLLEIYWVLGSMDVYVVVLGEYMVCMMIGDMVQE